MKVYIILFIIFLTIISGKTLKPRDDIIENDMSNNFIDSIDVVNDDDMNNQNFDLDDSSIDTSQPYTYLNNEDNQDSGTIENYSEESFRSKETSEISISIKKKTIIIAAIVGSVVIVLLLAVYVFKKYITKVIIYIK